MRIASLLLCLLHSLCAGAQERVDAASLQQMSWLVGSWKGTANKKPFYEAWRFANDSTMVNFSIEVTGTDTLVKESGALRVRGGLLYLGAAPTQWTATRLRAGELVLRNDSLRFSNTIIWLHSPEDHWLTILEHPKSTVFYDMTRDATLDRKVTDWIAQRRGR
ncbi:hypothetical protein [Flaviaesturariibacter amylovorans]|uniref:DUF1579 domain-containing protein n=1 Tax=Flaviaesturariibacter amylovorans TaxID=1084520 RepID=A0ABP8GSV3_9BACT